jgi:hypothetical protein
LVLQVLL